MASTNGGTCALTSEVSQNRKSSQYRRLLWSQPWWKLWWWHRLARWLSTLFLALMKSELTYCNSSTYYVHVAHKTLGVKVKEKSSALYCRLKITVVPPPIRTVWIYRKTADMPEHLPHPAPCECWWMVSSLYRFQWTQECRKAVLDPCAMSMVCWMRVKLK